MTLNFEAEVNVPFDFDVEALAGEVINFTLEHEDFPYEPEVNLTLVDNEGIHAINKEFREIDRPTDVLSFPMLSYENAGDFSKLEDDYDDNFNPGYRRNYAWRYCDLGGQGFRTGRELRAYHKKRVCISDRT